MQREENCSVFSRVLTPRKRLVDRDRDGLGARGVVQRRPVGQDVRRLDRDAAARREGAAHGEGGGTQGVR